MFKLNAAFCKSSSFFHSGALDFTRRFSLPDFGSINATFQHSKGWKETLHDFGKKSRSVPDFCFYLMTHLRYIPSRNGVYCAPCAIFSLVTRPLRDWRMLTPT